MAKPTKRRTALAYVRTASERLERAWRAAVKCPQVSQAELSLISRTYQSVLRVENTLRQRRGKV